MRLADRIGRFLNNAMNHVISIDELEQEKDELEQELVFAQNGGYSNTEEAIAGITEDLAQVNATIARRQTIARRRR